MAGVRSAFSAISANQKAGEEPEKPRKQRLGQLLGENQSRHPSSEQNELVEKLSYLEAKIADVNSKCQVCSFAFAMCLSRFRKVAR